MPLECKLREIPKSSFSGKDLNSPMKFGRYMKSIFPQVDGYGEKNWVVGCYVDFDYESLLEKMTEDEMVSSILDSLNEIPPRKKFERRPTCSLYGRLELLSYKLKKSDGMPFIEMLLITDDPKNENFWGEGVACVGTKKPRRRSRKAQDILD